MRIRKTLAAAAVTASLVAGALMPLASHAISSTSAEQSYSNYSIEQLEALIVKLQKRIAEMKQGSACFVSDKDLSIGDGEGDDLSADVRRLQEALSEKGHFKVKSTGYFGKYTRAALVAFQKEQGIAQTGEFDAATRAKLHAMYCQKTVKKSVEKKENKKEEKKEESKTVSAAQSITASVSGNKVSWTVVGSTKSGVKVVWSKHQNPTYPPTDDMRATYVDVMNGGSAYIEAFDGEGTYYVRVCEYIDGTCGLHSNQVQTQL
jgi:Putative peptidoglycan binding domain